MLRCTIFTAKTTSPAIDTSKLLRNAQHGPKKKLKNWPKKRIVSDRIAGVSFFLVTETSDSRRENDWLTSRSFARQAVSSTWSTVSTWSSIRIRLSSAQAAWKNQRNVSAESEARLPPNSSAEFPAFDSNSASFHFSIAYNSLFPPSPLPRSRTGVSSGFRNKPRLFALKTPHAASLPRFSRESVYAPEPRKRHRSAARASHVLLFQSIRSLGAFAGRARGHHRSRSFPAFRTGEAKNPRK